MKRLSKTLIILVMVFALTSLCGYQEAMAFDVWKTVRTVISATLDALGRCTARTQTVTSSGVNVDNEPYVSLQIMDYEVKNGFVTDRIVGRTNYSLSTTAEEGLSLDLTGKPEDIKNRIEAKKNALSAANKPFSYSTQTVTEFYDANGYLERATGTETLEGKDASWWEYKDAAGHILTKKENGTYYYIDPDTNREVTATLATSVLKEGNRYGTESDKPLKLDFVLINGEAEVTRRVGNIVYRDSAGKETFTRHLDTFNKYDEVVTSPTYGKLLSSETWQKDTYPETYKYNKAEIDPATGKRRQESTDTKLFRAQYVKTSYKYNDADGSLKDVTGTGYGWGLVNTSDGYMVYTSNITVTYEIKNGAARQSNYEENAYFLSAENSPDSIPIPVAQGVDPKGTIIDMFNIHSDEVPQGSDNAREFNQYTWLVVRVDLDDSGNPEKPDGKLDNDKVYLVRALTHAGRGNNDMIEVPVSGYNVGDTIYFLFTDIPLGPGGVSGRGDQTANRMRKLTKISKTPLPAGMNY